VAQARDTKARTNVSFRVPRTVLGPNSELLFEVAMRYKYINI
jgi:hypothetical protein